MKIVSIYIYELSETTRSLDHQKRKEMELRERLKESDKALKYQATARESAAAEAKLRLRQTEQALAEAQRDLRAEQHNAPKSGEKHSTTTGPAAPAGSSYHSWKGRGAAVTEQVIRPVHEKAKEWQDKAAQIARLASNVADQGELEEAAVLQRKACEVVEEAMRKREERKKARAAASSGGRAQDPIPYPHVTKHKPSVADPHELPRGPKVLLRRLDRWQRVPKGL